MLQKTNQQNKQGADFIVFLNQQFNDRKKEEPGIKIKGGLALKINKPARIKHAPKKNSLHEDEKIISILRSTVPPVKSSLDKILNKHFPEPETDIEERLVMEWLKKAMHYIRLFIENIASMAEPKRKRKKSCGRLYNFIFSVSEKSKQAKLETEEKLVTRPWVARLVVSGMVALFISITLVRYAPSLALKVTGFYDKIIVYPIMKIVKMTSPDLENYDFCANQTINRAKKSITKEMLSAYILKNGESLKNLGLASPPVIKITEEDLRGRVAGASAKAELTRPVSQKNYDLSVFIEMPDAGGFYDFLLSALENLTKKQRQISENLNEKLVELIKEKF